MILGAEQQEAINKILNWLDDKTKTSFSLVGAAGTGKSYTISQLLPKLELSYILCAPTHKAALVMRNYCNSSAITIHNLLALSPNLNIEKFDITKLLFEVTKKPNQIPAKGLIICDEASMINDDLFDLIIQKCKALQTKILFVSDKAQLLPVESTKYSKVYTNSDESYTLTKIYRQSEENCLIPILSDLRTKELSNIESTISPEGNITLYNDVKEYCKKCAELFTGAIENKDILYVKACAYTNKRVSNYNTIIQRYIWHDSELYHVGDILTAYSNGTCGCILSNGHKSNVPFNYYNGMDYIITNVEKGNKYIPVLNQNIDGYWLTLYDSYYKEYGVIFIITDKENINLVSYYLEDIRRKAIHNKKMWSLYYQMQKSYCINNYSFLDNRCIAKKDFDLGYCSTVHKLQGSSVENICIDLPNIKECKDKLVRRQLEYVAFSRTRHNVFILNNV